MATVCQVVMGLVVVIASVMSASANEAAVPATEAADVIVEVDCPTSVERCSSPCCTPCDLDVWLVSTRRLPGICGLPESADLGVERLLVEPCSRRWEQASLSELVSDPSRPLVIFAHGNRYSSADAKTQGLALARTLTNRACGVAPRVVIFSWPSQQQGILLKDARRKYYRAFADGHYLAWFLCQLEPEQPVALVSYSLGSLVVIEALEDLAMAAPGGIPWTERPGRTNLVFVTPAVRCDAFAPCGPSREALDGVDRFTLLINSRDAALKFFPKVDKNVRADALGYVGMPRRWIPEGLDYSAIDAAGMIGRIHTMWRYLESRSLSDRIVDGTVTGLTE